VLQVVDDALYSAAKAQRKTTNDVDAKFKKAIDALSAYEKKYYLRETITHTMAEAKVKDISYSTVFLWLKKTSRVRKYLDLCFATY
jgi:hypothetical protein